MAYLIVFAYKSKNNQYFAVSRESKTVKMRVLVLISLIVSLVSATYMTSGKKVADSEFLTKQRAIFEIFINIWQPEYHNKYYEEAKTFNYVDFKDKIKNQKAFKCFSDCYEKGLIEMEEIFSPFNEWHNHQMMSFFKILYYAQDWDTFYKFMVWGRFNINPGMFIQSVTMAVLHRDDFAGFVLPAIYEISPFYFFNSYVTTKTRRMYMEGVNNLEKVNNVYTYTVFSNYTNYYYDMNYESKLAYFTEGEYNL